MKNMKKVKVTISIPVDTLKIICSTALDYSLEQYFEDEVIIGALDRKEIIDELVTQVNWQELFQNGIQDDLDIVGVEYAKFIAWDENYDALKKAYDECESYAKEKTRGQSTYAGVK